ncbi:MAG: hypothetical protein ACOCP4_00115 [Candidatus Woesearchaeota archaeon]
MNKKHLLYLGLFVILFFGSFSNSVLSDAYYSDEFSGEFKKCDAGECCSDYEDWTEVQYETYKENGEYFVSDNDVNCYFDDVDQKGDCFPHDQDFPFTPTTTMKNGLCHGEDPVIDEYTIIGFEEFDLNINEVLSDDTECLDCLSDAESNHTSCKNDCDSENESCISTCDSNFESEKEDCYAMTNRDECQYLDDCLYSFEETHAHTEEDPGDECSYDQNDFYLPGMVTVKEIRKNSYGDLSSQFCGHDIYDHTYCNMEQGNAFCAEDYSCSGVSSSNACSSDDHEDIYEYHEPISAAINTGEISSSGLKDYAITSVDSSEGLTKKYSDHEFFNDISSENPLFFRGNPVCVLKDDGKTCDDIIDTEDNEIAEANITDYGFYPGENPEDLGEVECIVRDVSLCEPHETEYQGECVDQDDLIDCVGCSYNPNLIFLNESHFINEDIYKECDGYCLGLNEIIYNYDHSSGELDITHGGIPGLSVIVLSGNDFKNRLSFFANGKVEVISAEEPKLESGFVKFIAVLFIVALIVVTGGLASSLGAALAIGAAVGAAVVVSTSYDANSLSQLSGLSVDFAYQNFDIILDYDGGIHMFYENIQNLYENAFPYFINYSIGSFDVEEYQKKIIDLINLYNLEEFNEEINIESVSDSMFPKVHDLLTPQWSSLFNIYNVSTKDEPSIDEGKYLDMGIFFLFDLRSSFSRYVTEQKQFFPFDFKNEKITFDIDIKYLDSERVPNQLYYKIYELKKSSEIDFTKNYGYRFINDYNKIEDEDFSQRPHQNLFFFDDLRGDLIKSGSCSGSGCDSWDFDISIDDFISHLYDGSGKYLIKFYPRSAKGRSRDEDIYFLGYESPKPAYNKFEFDVTLQKPVVNFEFKIDRETGILCYDGIDNDEDGDVDWNDSDCMEWLEEEKNFADPVFRDWCNQNDWLPEPCEYACTSLDEYDYQLYDSSDVSSSLIEGNELYNRSYAVCCGMNGLKDVGKVIHGSDGDLVPDKYTCGVNCSSGENSFENLKKGTRLPNYFDHVDNKDTSCNFNIFDETGSSQFIKNYYDPDPYDFSNPYHDYFTYGTLGLGGAYESRMWYSCMPYNITEDSLLDVGYFPTPHQSVFEFYKLHSPTYDNSLEIDVFDIEGSGTTAVNRFETPSDLYFNDDSNEYSYNDIGVDLSSDFNSLSDIQNHQLELNYDFRHYFDEPRNNCDPLGIGYNTYQRGDIDYRCNIYSDGPYDVLYTRDDIYPGAIPFCDDHEFADFDYYNNLTYYTNPYLNYSDTIYGSIYNDYYRNERGGFFDRTEYPDYSNVFETCIKYGSGNYFFDQQGYFQKGYSDRFMCYYDKTNFENEFGSFFAECLSDYDNSKYDSGIFHKFIHGNSINRWFPIYHENHSDRNMYFTYGFQNNEDNLILKRDEGDFGNYLETPEDLGYKPEYRDYYRYLDNYSSMKIFYSDVSYGSSDLKLIVHFDNGTVEDQACSDCEENAISNKDQCYQATHDVFESCYPDNTKSSGTDYYPRDECLKRGYSYFDCLSGVPTPTEYVTGEECYDLCEEGYFSCISTCCVDCEGIEVKIEEEPVDDYNTLGFSSLSECLNEYSYIECVEAPGDYDNTIETDCFLDYDSNINFCDDFSSNYLSSCHGMTNLDECKKTIDGFSFEYDLTNQSYGLPLSSTWKYVEINIPKETKGLPFLGVEIISDRDILNQEDYKIHYDYNDYSSLILFGGIEFIPEDRKTKYCGLEFIDSSTEEVVDESEVDLFNYDQISVHDKWFDNLNENEKACDSRLETYWTGTRCCGVNGSETYLDTEAACFQGMPFYQGELSTFVNFRYDLLDGSSFESTIPYFFPENSRMNKFYTRSSIFPCEYDITSNKLNQSLSNCYFSFGNYIRLDYGSLSSNEDYDLFVADSSSGVKKSLFDSPKEFSNSDSVFIEPYNDSVNISRTIAKSYISYYNESFRLCNPPQWVIDIFDELNTNTEESITYQSYGVNDDVDSYEAPGHDAEMIGSLSCSLLGWVREGVYDNDTLGEEHGEDFVREYINASDERDHHTYLPPEIFEDQYLIEEIESLGYPEEWVDDFRWGVCPEGWCWNGTGCTKNQEHAIWEEPIFYDGDYFNHSDETLEEGYKCAYGEWVEAKRTRSLISNNQTHPAYAWPTDQTQFDREDSSYEGVFPCVVYGENELYKDPSDKLLFTPYESYESSFYIFNESRVSKLTYNDEEDLNPDLIKSVELFENSAGEDLLAPSLYKSGRFLGRYYCNDGEWESRTGFLANLLINEFKFSGDTNAFCGTNHDLKEYLKNIDFSIGDSDDINSLVDGFCSYRSDEFVTLSFALRPKILNEESWLSYKESIDEILEEIFEISDFTFDYNSFDSVQKQSAYDSYGETVHLRLNLKRGLLYISYFDDSKFEQLFLTDNPVMGILNSVSEEYDISFIDDSKIYALPNMIVSLSDLSPTKENTLFRFFVTVDDVDMNLFSKNFRSEIFYYKDIENKISKEISGNQYFIERKYDGLISYNQSEGDSYRTYHNFFSLIPYSFNTYRKDI